MWLIGKYRQPISGQWIDAVCRCIAYHELPLFRDTGRVTGKREVQDALLKRAVLFGRLSLKQTPIRREIELEQPVSCLKIPAHHTQTEQDMCIDQSALPQRHSGFLLDLVQCQSSDDKKPDPEKIRGGDK